MELSEYSGIWVFAEQWDGRIHPSAAELISKGRELADEGGQRLTAVILGSGLRKEAEKLLPYGPDEILIVEDEGCRYPEKGYVSVLFTELILERKPSVVLYAATTFGRGFAPMTAARLRTGLTADCTALSFERETGLLHQTRPAFGGNIMATIVCRDRRPQMATVRPGVFKKRERPDRAEGVITAVPIPGRIPERRVRILGIREGKPKTGDLSAAQLIVSGGAGLSSKEAFSAVERCAEALGGTYGASRAAVDLGYAPPERQVGQTGTSVSPKVYIAAGISGAVQHAVGIQGADTVIAVNTDPDAPIFSMADLGAVGDAEKILEALTRLAEQEKTEQKSGEGGSPDGR